MHSHLSLSSTSWTVTATNEEKRRSFGMAAVGQESEGEERSCGCVLENLKIRPFCAIGFELQKEIISRGRPMPDLTYIQTKTKRCVRHFNVEQYAKTNWLCGCRKTSKLYCWPCVLFSNERGTWNRCGFDDMNNLLKAMQRHQQSQNHVRSEIFLTTFGSMQIDFQLDEQLKQETAKFNEQVKSNRKVVLRLIDVVVFLACQEFSFRSHNKTEDSVNRGNYIELLLLLGKFDETINNHFQKATIFSEISKHIQNDLIESIANVVMTEIKKEIQQSQFIAVILDETSDIFSHSQLSTVLRYILPDGEITERFLGFSDVSPNRTASALAEHVFSTLNKYNCSVKLVAHCYDGAAVMSGEINSLQKKVRDQYPDAVFVHCLAHCLNLVLSQSVSRIKECNIFFMTLRRLSFFFSNSTKRTAALDLEVKKRFLKVCPTSWNYNSRLVETIRENKCALINLFSTILDTPENWDKDTYHEARGFDSALSDFDFNFLLFTFSEIFCLTTSLHTMLQSKALDVKYCAQKIKEVEELLRNKRNDFGSVWDKCKEDIGQPWKRCCLSDGSDVKSYFHCLYCEIYDDVCNQIEVRFCNLDNLVFLQLVDEKNIKSVFPEEAFTCLKQNYGQHFDFVRLRSELCVVYSSNEYLSMGITKLLLYLSSTDLSTTAFKEFYKLCALVATIPVTSHAAEHSTSALWEIHTYCRNMQGQVRLSQLSLPSIERKLVKLKQIENEDEFYKMVIEEFGKKSRRIDLHFK